MWRRGCVVVDSLKRIGAFKSLALTSVAGAAAATAGVAYFAATDSPYDVDNDLDDVVVRGRRSRRRHGGFLEVDAGHSYDPRRLEEFWLRRPLEVVQRSLQVLQVSLPYLAKLFIWEYGVRRKIRNHEGLQHKYAVELRLRLTQLGPCFVKFGQALSIRPDILPSVFLTELQRLCDSVPSFPTARAIAVIESELGEGSAKRLFEDLQVTTPPVAAASLGQVYKLRLRGSGEWVAVKVQRPDMTRFILRDLFIIRTLARCVEKVKSVLTNQRPYDVALVDTFAKASLEELDYLKEAENQEFFRRELVPKMGGLIYVPKVFAEVTTHRVLVTEWIHGQKLASSPPEVIERLTPMGIKCFLCQLLDTGYFHADPHPGNLLVTQDGKLALIDFGLCAEVPKPDTRNIAMAIVHLMKGDVPGLIGDAIALGFLPPDIDMPKLQDALQKVFDGAMKLVIQDEVQGGFRAIKKRRRQFWAVSSDLNKIFFEYPFLVPEYFALITRAMIVLEGIAVTGDPDFDLFSASYPIAFKIAVQRFRVRDISEILSGAYKAASSRPDSLQVIH